MANKIISFGNTQQKSEQSATDSMIVYKDLSMISKYVNTQIAAKHQIPSDFYAILKAEGVDEILYDDIYTLFVLQYNNDLTPSIDNINKILKQLSVYKIDNLINIYAIKNSLHNIFTWRPGERVLNPEFGSRLYMLLYEGITPITEERIIAEIRHCVSVWEPRVQIIEVRDVSTIDDTENNTIHLEIVYVIPSLSNEQYSYSFIYNRAER